MGRSGENEVISFYVQGEPAPQGSKRFVGIHNGKGRMIESSKKVKPWREAVYWAAIEAKSKTPMVMPMDGPLAVVMVFALPKPTSVRRAQPDRKPDLSKLVRSTEDALVDAGLIADDARIVVCLASKIYPRPPFKLMEERIDLRCSGAFISIEHMEKTHDAHEL